MPTVLIRLEGPMQAWGLSGRGTNSAHRATQPRPTKSGVIGLVANALGRDWADDITDLASLRFGVRVDRPGELESDYHTTGTGDFPLLPGDIYAHPGWARKAKTYSPGEPFSAPYVAPADVDYDANGVLTAKPGLTVITRDWYLADASFLAALCGDHAITGPIADALAAPARTLYLGRRAYLPSQPLLAGHHDAALSEALTCAPAAERTKQESLDAWIEPEKPSGAVQTIHDQPISYNGPTSRGARLEQHTRIPVAVELDRFYSPDRELNPEVTP
ncbi:MULTISPECIES: CRISPR-associated protein Cas5 [Mycolicibacter]|uniref:CRISPR-associated protein Cas5 n=2 Tax=Mycolicibacter TaxID=1073531 RepID=A0ABU5XNQ6_9MYCO|nr:MULTISPECIES: CRISPR-associated protein Cas5 [unclassified Mycolicibacter]MEB3023397.1 CRISPR-associated protein Cas5 [Mycolicibacter sp. MYC098]MEB3033739.1 CRISPR-associated protein Cas5 [Mycolicibacter sp. MYC340]